VFVDGHDVRDLTISSLRKRIGVVMQDSVLFSGSVRDNIAYGRPDASDDDVEAAARAAQAHDFITRAAAGLRDPRGRARHQALRRSAPAHRDRAGTADRPAYPHHGRLDLER
jgi:ABC-type protease/lipase transport system fused ATPase/permease subunit